MRWIYWSREPDLYQFFPGSGSGLEKNRDPDQDSYPALPERLDPEPYLVNLRPNPKPCDPLPLFALRN